MISVCIATHNASKYIHAQIISILNQVGPEDELIVSDDVSTDDTIAIINKINDPRIKVISGSVRLGIIKNFERALYAAKGSLIFLSDQDDVWLPNKVNVCKTALAKHTLVVTDCIVVDSNLNHVAGSFFVMKNSKKGILLNIYKNSYIGCCMAFKRELLDVALPFPSNIPMHDVWLGLLAEIKGNVVFLNEKLVLYRRHDKNASFMESKNSVLRKIQLRLLLISNLAIRLVSATNQNNVKNNLK
ncbi:MAG: glycosyltransferase family 2 protein [Methylophilus sp.]|nr:glycosyltransferase family 2 protein [Methylophilus sp.]